MASAATRLLTADEFYEFVHRPENEGRFFELEEGVVVEMPPPFRRHGRICANLSALLHEYSKLRRAGEVVSNDSGIILSRSPDTVRAPDVVFYKEAMKYEDLPEQYVEEMPLLVVEVLSPNDSTAETALKLDSFLQRGAELAWLVDPDERSVTYWRKGRRPMVAKDGDEIANLAEMPGFVCPVKEIFDSPGV